MRPAVPPACPKCGALRNPGPECARCGVIYARARPRPLAPAEAPPELAPGDARGLPLLHGLPATWTGARDDLRRELLVGALAPPAALLLAWALVSTGGGRFVLRTFLAMWIHELGHAVTAWWCGFGALPGPWRTFIGADRRPFVVLVLAGALGLTAWRAWRARRTLVAAGAGVALAAQVVCTLLPAKAAQALVTFGGDAGAMVLGGALFATIWSHPEGRLGRGALRWGFLAIGAAALVDALHTWVGALRDPAVLPLGRIEGVGLSDASKLMEVHGWSAGALAGRYVALGVVVLLALGAGWAVALTRARAALQPEAASPRPS